MTEEGGLSHLVVSEGLNLDETLLTTAWALTPGLISCWISQTSLSKLELVIGVLHQVPVTLSQSKSLGTRKPFSYRLHNCQVFFLGSCQVAFLGYQLPAK